MLTIDDSQIEAISGGNYYGDTLVNMGTASGGIGIVFGQPEIVMAGGVMAGAGALINLLWS